MFFMVYKNACMKFIRLIHNTNYMDVIFRYIW